MRCVSSTPRMIAAILLALAAAAAAPRMLTRGTSTCGALLAGAGATPSAPSQLPTHTERNPIGWAGGLDQTESLSGSGNYM
eukprot:SAG25_NODE_3772_length_975_cov_0.517123_2_plen_81_part_00